MTGRLQGKAALITGAGCIGPGWGNGRATAVAFAREGARIFAVDRDLAAMEETEALVREAGGEIVLWQADVTRSESVKAMTDACHERFGRIDVLVNNVGAGAPGGPVEMSEEVWDAQIDLNLKSVFLTLKHVLPIMEAQGAGAVINLGSSAALRWTGAMQVAYAAAKAGVLQLTKVVAVQYAKKGVRVNAVVPGQLHTPMIDIRTAKNQAGGDVEALLARRLARIPVGFMGDGRDTANAVVFLASDEARFITGEQIVVDGGMTVRCD